MNLLKLIFRDRQTASLEAVELWEVRWAGRDGEYKTSIVPRVRAFVTKEDAEEFKSALTDAFKLIGYIGHEPIRVSKQSA